jgi:hypothetical protein
MNYTTFVLGLYDAKFPPPSKKIMAMPTRISKNLKGQGP